MTPHKILELIESRLGIEAPPVRLQDAIELTLSVEFGLSSIDAAEKAEKLRGPVGRQIDIRARDAASAGIAPILVAIGSMADQICGSCHVLPDDPDIIIAAKGGRANIKSLLARIQSLSFAEFELFGKCVLAELGAHNARVTPHGGDQGIDFFGEFRFSGLQSLPYPFVKLAHDVRLLFLGQAKHYPSRSLGPDIVRELVGAASLARTKTFSTDGVDLFGELNIRPFSPVVAMLFTTGGITMGAYRLAEQAGLVVKNGNQLAAFLADRGIGVGQAEGKAVFDEALFQSWLHG
jgi:hypothetical protein